MKNIQDYIPDYLPALPSFFSGVASTINLSGNIVGQVEFSRAPQGADRKALESDFRAIGKDIAVVVGKKKLPV